jgi:phage/plasmid-associated DNA primase
MKSAAGKCQTVRIDGKTDPKLLKTDPNESDAAKKAAVNVAIHTVTIVNAPKNVQKKTPKKAPKKAPAPKRAPKKPMEKHDDDTDIPSKREIDNCVEQQVKCVDMNLESVNKPTLVKIDDVIGSDLDILDSEPQPKQEPQPEPKSETKTEPKPETKTDVNTEISATTSSVAENDESDYDNMVPVFEYEAPKVVLEVTPPVPTFFDIPKIETTAYTQEQLGNMTNVKPAMATRILEAQNVVDAIRKSGNYSGMNTPNLFNAIKFLSQVSPSMPDMKSRGKNAIVNFTRISGGKFAIENVPEFLYLLQRMVHKGYMIDFVEKVSELDRTPFKIDFDVHYQKVWVSNPVRQITPEHCSKIIGMYNKSIREIINIDNEKTLEAHLFMRREPYVECMKGEYKDGLHIIYPYLLLEEREQRAIRNGVINDILKDDTHKPFFYWAGGLLCDTSQKIEDIIDESIYGGGWQPLGCRKAIRSMRGDDGKYYKLERDVTKKEYVDKTILAPFYDPKYYSPCPTGTDFTEKDRVYLPPYLLVNVYDHKCKVITDSLGNNEKNSAVLYSMGYHGDKVTDFEFTEEYSEKLKAEKPKTQPSPIPIGSDIVKKIEHGTHAPGDIEGYLKLINVARFDNYGDWIKIGIILFNESTPQHSYLDTWITFSKKSPKFKDGECEGVWAKMSCKSRDYRVTVGTLRYWAKNDNPAGYKILIDAMIEPYLDACIENNGHEKETAELIHRILGHTVMYDSTVCTPDNKDGIWFEFNGNLWKRISKIFTFIDRCVDDVICPMIEGRIKKVRSAIDALYEAQKEAETEAKKAKIGTEIAQLYVRVKKLTKCRNTVTSVSGINKYIIKLRKLVTVDYSGELLDSSNYTFGFNNCIVDLLAKNEKDMVRTGCPDDFISMSCGYDYVEYNESDPEVAKARLFLSQLYPNTVVRDYVVSIISQCLFGMNISQKFIIMHGIGANGKSALHNQIRLCFGQYGGNLNSSYVTEKKGSADSASTALNPLRGVRYVAMNEPSEEEKFYLGQIKELTGEGRIVSRKLFSEGSDMALRFTLFMYANDVPKLQEGKSGSRAVKRRFTVVPHKSIFTNDPTEVNNLNIFKRNDSLPYLQMKLREAFMWIFVHRAYEIAKMGNFDIEQINGVPEPKIITAEYEEIIASNDPVHGCVMKHIMLSGDPPNTPKGKMKFVRSAELWEVFKSEHYDTKLNEKTFREKIMEEDILKNKFLKNFCASTTNGRVASHLTVCNVFLGVKMRSDETKLNPMCDIYDMYGDTPQNYEDAPKDDVPLICDDIATVEAPNVVTTTSQST